MDAAADVTKESAVVDLTDLLDDEEQSPPNTQPAPKPEPKTLAPAEVISLLGSDDEEEGVIDLIEDNPPKPAAPVAAPKQAAAEPKPPRQGTDVNAYHHTSIDTALGCEDKANEHNQVDGNGGTVGSPAQREVSLSSSDLKASSERCPDYDFLSNANAAKTKGKSCNIQEESSDDEFLFGAQTVPSVSLSDLGPSIHTDAFINSQRRASLDSEAGTSHRRRDSGENSDQARKRRREELEQQRQLKKEEREREKEERARKRQVEKEAKQQAAVEAKRQKAEDKLRERETKAAARVKEQQERQEARAAAIRERQHETGKRALEDIRVVLERRFFEDKDSCGVDVRGAISGMDGVECSICDHPIHGVVQWQRMRKLYSDGQSEPSQSQSQSQAGCSTSGQGVWVQENVAYCAIVLNGAEYMSIVESEGGIRRHAEQVVRAFPGYTLNYVIYGLATFLKQGRRQAWKQVQGGGGGQQRAYTLHDAESELLTLAVARHHVRHRIYDTKQDVQDFVTQMTKLIANAPYRTPTTRLDIFGKTGKVNTAEDLPRQASNWMKALNAFPGVSPIAAEAIARAYPSLSLLIDAFNDMRIPERERQRLVAGLIKISPEGQGARPDTHTERSLGNKLSERLFDFFTATNPQQPCRTRFSD